MMNRTKTFILLLTLFSLSLAAQTPPPPNVPLDGGLIGLIAAGGALGYKKYKARNSNSKDDFKA